MSDVVLKIPGESLQGAKIPRKRIESELLKELALQLYREELITHAGACRLAGLEKAAFQFLLGERGIAQQLNCSDLDKDLENWSAWNQE